MVPSKLLREPFSIAPDMSILFPAISVFTCAFPERINEPISGVKLSSVNISPCTFP